MLYIAYGSNMNRDQMSVRCPHAKPLGAYYLDGWRLVFIGVADIIKDKDARVPIVLWTLPKNANRTWTDMRECQDYIARSNSTKTRQNI